MKKAPETGLFHAGETLRQSGSADARRDGMNFVRKRRVRSERRKKPGGLGAPHPGAGGKSPGWREGRPLSMAGRGVSYRAAVRPRPVSHSATSFSAPETREPRTSKPSSRRACGQRLRRSLTLRPKRLPS